MKLSSYERSHELGEMHGMVIAAAGGAFSVGIGHAGASVRPLVFISGGPPRACIDFRVINSPDRSTQRALLSWRESPTLVALC